MTYQWIEKFQIFTRLRNSMAEIEKKNYKLRNFNEIEKLKQKLRIIHYIYLTQQLRIEIKIQVEDKLVKITAPETQHYFQMYIRMNIYVTHMNTDPNNIDRISKLRKSKDTPLSKEC